MEIIMKTDIEKSVPAVIEFNFEELKADLETKLEKYNNLVVTEDSIKDAKADKSSLNKLSKMLNDNRIAQEKSYMAPFKAYKVKVDELIALINKPVLAIDKQIKVFDDKEIADKLEAITHFYTTNIGLLQDVLPMEKILNDKWANKGTALLTITQEMVDKIITVKNDLRIIEAMKLDCETQMKDAYLKNLNMSEALAEKNRFEEQQKKLAEIKAKEAEKAKEVVPIAEPPVETCRAKSFEQPVHDVEHAEATKTIKVIFYDTTQAFRYEMKALTQKHNIRYGGIQ